MAALLIIDSFAGGGGASEDMRLLHRSIRLARRLNCTPFQVPKITKQPIPKIYGFEKYEVGRTFIVLVCNAKCQHRSSSGNISDRLYHRHPLTPNVEVLVWLVWITMLECGCYTPTDVQRTTTFTYNILKSFKIFASVTTYIENIFIRKLSTLFVSQTKPSPVCQIPSGYCKIDCAVGIGMCPRKLVDIWKRVLHELSVFPKHLSKEISRRSKRKYFSLIAFGKVRHQHIGCPMMFRQHSKRKLVSYATTFQMLKPAGALLLSAPACCGESYAEVGVKL